MKGYLKAYWERLGYNEESGPFHMTLFLRNQPFINTREAMDEDTI